MPLSMVDTRSTRKALPYWERRIAAYLRTGVMPHQWTCARVEDRRCARCGRSLRGWGLKHNPRNVPACERCDREVAQEIVNAWEVMEGVDG